MQNLDKVIYDKVRGRKIPISIYLPQKKNGHVVLFNPGYQKQINLSDNNVVYENKKYQYLAEFFTNKGYVFVSIQHDVLGDLDGLETIDQSLPQHDAREHLYKRGLVNILFVISKLRITYPELDFANLIMMGHSNGGDIAQYFSNTHYDIISDLILLDARRCRVAPSLLLKTLRFEAIDTSTDNGVIPDEGTQDCPKRFNGSWMVIKPKNAFHKSYYDSEINEDLKNVVYKAIDWFLKFDF